MDYSMRSPCDECPFLVKYRHGYTIDRLEAFAAGAFHCHKTGTTDDDTGDFIATERSVACAGALIYLEKRNRPNQMMRIADRLGLYDQSKLDMSAKVR